MNETRTDDQIRQADLIEQAHGVARCLKLEIDILCGTLRGAAYNTVWEDNPKFARLVTDILVRSIK
jgi:hypothetical protein